MIKRLWINNFRRFSELDLFLNRLTIVSGKSGTGKTSIIGGIEQAFTKKNKWIVGNKTTSKHQVKNGCTTARIKVIFNDNFESESDDTIIDVQIPSASGITKAQADLMEQLNVDEKIISSCLRTGYFLNELNDAEQKKLLLDVKNNVSSRDFYIKELNEWSPFDLGDWCSRFLDEILTSREDSSGNVFTYNRRKEARLKRDEIKKKIEGLPEEEPLFLSNIDVNLVREKVNEANIQLVLLKDGQQKNEELYKEQLKTYNSELKEYERIVKGIEDFQKEKTKKESFRDKVHSQLKGFKGCGIVKSVDQIRTEIKELETNSLKLETERNVYSNQIKTISKSDKCLKNTCAKVQIAELQSNAINLDNQLNKLTEQLKNLNRELLLVTQEQNELEKLRSQETSIDKDLENFSNPFVLVQKPNPPVKILNQDNSEELRSNIVSWKKQIKDFEETNEKRIVWEKTQERKKLFLDEFKRIDVEARNWELIHDAFGFKGIKMKFLKDLAKSVSEKVTKYLEPLGMTFELTHEPWEIFVTNDDGEQVHYTQLSNSEAVKASLGIQAYFAHETKFNTIGVDGIELDGESFREQLMKCLLKLSENIQVILCTTLSKTDEKGKLIPPTLPESLRKNGRVNLYYATKEGMLVV